MKTQISGELIVMLCISGCSWYSFRLIWCNAPYANIVLIAEFTCIYHHHPWPSSQLEVTCTTKHTTGAPQHGCSSLDHESISTSTQLPAFFGLSGPQNSFPFDSLHRKPRGMSFGMQHDVHHLWPPNGWMVVPLMLGWTAKNLPLGLAVYPTYLSDKIIDPFGGLYQHHTHHCTMVQSWMKCCGFDIWDCQMVLDVNTVDGLEIMQTS